MSRFQSARTRSFIAGADLSGNKYHVVKFGTNDEEVILAGAGEGFGILMNSPKAGETAEVAMIGGGAQVHSGAAFGRGVELASNASGKLVAAAAGNRVIGLSIKAASAADEYVEIERVFYIKP